MSAQTSPSQWYIAGTGSGTVDYPSAASPHGVTATFTSSTMSGRRCVLDSVNITKVGTGDDLTFVDSAGTTLFVVTLLATTGNANHKLLYLPNGIDMGSGFGCKITQTDWKIQIGYRFTN